MRKFGAALLLLLAVMPAAHAQSFDASQWTQGVTTISAPWRFHPGDDAHWASPSFDDSSWPLLITGKSWSFQGYRGYSGYAWYRLRVKLPATRQPLGINIGHVNSAAEVYADGLLIGTNGVMRPKPDWSEQIAANAFPLPAAGNGRWVEIAVRVWKSPVASSYSGGGFNSHPVVGSLALLQAAQRVAVDNEIADRLSFFTMDFLGFVLGCFSLGLFLLDRRSTEYAWFAVWGIGTFALNILVTTVILHRGSVTFVEAGDALIDLPLYFAELLFLWGFLKVKPDWLLGLAFFFNTAFTLGLVLAYSALIPLPAGQAIATAGRMVVFVVVIVRVFISLRAGNRDARLLILPILLIAWGSIVENFRSILFFAGLAPQERELTFWSNGIVTVDWNDIFGVLYLISIGTALLLRFTRATNEQRRLSTELAAAREVQSKLVPAQLPALPGLRVEAAYLPATEVGGDFYQLFPLPDRSSLIVVGDVSGKGLKAAMNGTLALGALRALAQENLPPAEILHRLNAQLAAAPNDGFITCLCAHVAADGAVNFANAGHLAPYLNGEEAPCEPGLPLGLAQDVTYTPASLTLAPGDTLTLLSDGVVEARNSAGELFGFDRTRAISTESAPKIAQAAQVFGQEDDITVLTLTRIGAVEEPARNPLGIHLAPALNPVKS